MWGTHKSPNSRAFLRLRKELGRGVSHYLIGGRGRNRTYNLSVKSRMLCQLSYASMYLRKAVRRQASHAEKQTGNPCWPIKNIAQPEGRFKTTRKRQWAGLEI